MLFQKINISEQFTKSVRSFKEKLLGFINSLGSKKKSRNLLEGLVASDHPLYVTFIESDLPRVLEISQLLSSERTYSPKEFERIRFEISEFQSVVDSVDYSDIEHCWNFFDAGLDILITTISEILCLEKIKNFVLSTFKDRRRNKHSNQPFQWTSPVECIAA